ncbi:splicing factor 3b subunit 4 [Phaffia rhodozyma]|uniref:Splicing factor 3B subunit 4 n=1 Tax=Phaffia rhodozyma TaxID=264483 RepID=A0A0F7SQP5_PHARH|nr:splicing factor 3b subunit 4 [Phaffia rhodozyma]
MSRAPHEFDRNQEATVYLGNLDERCTDALVWELMLQAGPVVNVHLPKDRISQAHQGFGFCEFLGEEDAEYACRIMNQIKLYGKPIRVNKASYDKKQLDVGANLFIGNLDPNVDERLLYDTFSTFGIVSQQAKIARDPATGVSKGYGFIAYNDFEASDAAIEAMSNQFLMNKAITVQYAFKKDGKGERHGTEAERLLAQQAKKNNALPGGVSMGGRPGGGPPPPGMAGGVTGANSMPVGFGSNPYPNPVVPNGGMPGPPPGFHPSQIQTTGSYMPPPPPGFQMPAQGAPTGTPPPPPPPPPGYGAYPAQQRPSYPNYPPPPAGFTPQNYSVPPPGWTGRTGPVGNIPPPPPPPPMA